MKYEFDFSHLKYSAVGLSSDFECRWSLEGKKFVETPLIKKRFRKFYFSK